MRRTTRTARLVKVPAESFLLDVLTLGASIGEFSLADAVNSIGAGRAFATSPVPRILDPQSPNYMAVASAMKSLTEAGLLERGSPGMWRLSKSGTEVLRNEPQSFSFDDLRQYPAFVEAGKRRSRDRHRLDWCTHRLEHYAGGRQLFLTGNLSGSALLLGYALEFHLKAALAECEDLTSEERNQTQKHNFVKLYTICQQHGLLKDTFISTEFLRYASDHFRRRYPSGHRELVEDHGYWQFGGTVLDTYDDAVAQLDTSLARIYESSDYLLGVRAFTDAGEGAPMFEAYFHRNVFAVAQLRSSSELQRVALRAGDSIEARCDDLFDREGLPPPGMKFQRASHLAEWNLAALFRYPKSDEPDPDPSRLVFRDVVEAARRAGVRRGLRVVEQAVREFGLGATDLSEDRETREVVLTVFDRRAKQWHREIVLCSQGRELVSESVRDREHVEKWLEETRARFRRLRPKQRIPKIAMRG